MVGLQLPICVFGGDKRNKKKNNDATKYQMSRLRYALQLKIKRVDDLCSS